MKIFNNFLNEEEYKQIKSVLFGPDFPWYYNDGTVFDSESHKKYDFQFVHIFYEFDKINSNYFNLLKPILNKIKYFSLLRIKANLTTQTPSNIIGEMHTDYKVKPKNANITTGIFYLNNNDGYTKFFKKEIYSEDNKYVEFDGTTKHAAVSSTNSYIRVVLNLNYIKL